MSRPPTVGVGVRIGAFALILLGAVLIPAPVRAGEALKESAVGRDSPTTAPVPRILPRG